MNYKCKTTEIILKFVFSDNIQCIHYSKCYDDYSIFNDCKYINNRGSIVINKTDLCNMTDTLNGANIRIHTFDEDKSRNINDIGYIKISRFASTTHQEFVEALAKLKGLGMKKLVLDLQSNPGGYLDQAISLLSKIR